MKHRLSIIALLLALCVSLYFVNSGSRAAPAAQTWEYKFENKCDEKRANALGAEGWELAGTPNIGITTTFSIYVFKRPK